MLLVLLGQMLLELLGQIVVGVVKVVVYPADIIISVIKSCLELICCFLLFLLLELLGQKVIRVIRTKGGRHF